MRKNLVIIGCSYTHWNDSKALHETYPALIAKDFKDYDVYDLSIGGSSNTTAYLRCKGIEDKYNIKIDKVIFQITHFSRLFIYTDDFWLDDYSDLFNDYNNKDNYFYTSGEINSKFGFHVTSNIKNKLKILNDKYGTKTSKKYIEKEIVSWRGKWETLQQVELINSIYDTKFFSWFDYQNHALDEMLANKSCIGHIGGLMGSSEIFKEQSIDAYGHLTADGHRTLYTNMKRQIESWL
jgi:hypothetical protein